MTEERPTAPGEPKPADEPVLPSEAVIAAMERTQTPEQQEIAGELFRRLSAGEDVDDVKSLIDKMAQVMVRQQRERKGQAGGGPA
jgi:predicted transcriptional regulator